ncbi:unnamed protein product [Caenorhabditis brenneri]
MSASEEQEPSEEFYERYDAIQVANQCIELFCVIVNTFHLLVLFRKPLRSNAVFMIMIEICIFEIIFFLQTFFEELLDLSFSTYDPICIKETLEHIEPLMEMWNMISNMSSRMFVWLMVQLALIRTLSISFPMMDWLVKPRTTILVSLLIFLFWWFLFYWPLLFFRYYWKPDVATSKTCLDWIHQKGAEYKKYILAIPYEYGFPYSNFLYDSEGTIRVITIAVYILLVLLLVFKLTLLNQKRRKMNLSSSSDNTTVLIFVMTITFFIAESSAAAVAFFEQYKLQTDESMVLFGYIHINSLSGFARSLRVLNSASHAVICYFMSSQYRDTVYKMVYRKKDGKVRKAMMVIPSTTSNGSGKRKVSSGY